MGGVRKKVLEPAAGVSPLYDARGKEIKISEASYEHPADPSDYGFRRLTESSDKDLSPLTHDRMLDIAFYLYDTTPLGKWLIDTTKNFVVGDGFSYETTNPDVKKVLDDHWFNPINKWPLKLSKRVTDLSLFGELILAVFVNEYTGAVRLANIDPKTVRKVVMDPDNAEVSIGIVFKTRPATKYRIIYNEPDADIFTEDTIKAREEFKDGSCFYFSINTVSNATRGRSDLFAPADWIDAYENFLFDTLDYARLLRAFVYDVKLSGFNQEKINEWLKNNSTPKPNSYFAHNENVELNTKSPDLKAADTSEAAKTVRNHILGARAFPEHWFGGGGDVNRAVGAEMGTPTFRTLSERQSYVKYIIEEIFEFVITSSAYAGMLNNVPAEEIYQYSVVTPEVSTKDTAAISTSLQQIATALGVAQVNGWLGREDCSKVFNSLVSQLGVDINYEKALENALNDKTANATEDYA